MVLEPLFGDCYAAWTREQFMLDAECHGLIQHLRGLDHIDGVELDNTVVGLVKRFSSANANGALRNGGAGPRIDETVGENGE